MENSLDHELLGIIPPRFPEIDQLKEGISEREDKMIRDIFPVKTWITPWALLGNRLSFTNCVGARTLRRVLEKKGINTKYLRWGNDRGSFVFNDKQYFISSDTLMMDQYFPRRVTLRIIN